MSEAPRRTTSYQRLVEKLKRNPSERVDPKDWIQPKTPKEVIQHAIKGCIRAFVLAYGVRATVNFCLYLIRIMRGKASWNHILDASLKI
jgi:hypothetical protein